MDRISFGLRKRFVLVPVLDLDERKVLGEDNFVLAICEAYVGEDHVAICDLYRMEEGKIAER